MDEAVDAEKLLAAAQALAAGKAARGAEDKRRTHGVLKAELNRAALEVLFGRGMGDTVPPEWTAAQGAKL